MTSAQIIFTASITLAALGLIFELTSNRRKRAIKAADGAKPEFIHRNLRLVGQFKYKAGNIYYHAFCLGPFIFMPIGCYLGEGKRLCEIKGRQKSDAFEIIALYCRWGWLVAAITLALMVL